MSTFVKKSNKTRTLSPKGLQKTNSKASNVTYKCNRTFTPRRNPNRTFNTRTSNRTFRTSANPMQTFNIENKNQTFDMPARAQQTYNVSSSRMQNFSHGAQSSLNRTYDKENPIGPQPAHLQFSSEEKKLLNRIEIICMEIRSFIMSIYKFFCNNQDCNWGAIYTLIGEIDFTTQSMINEIFMQQLRIDDEREATRFSSDQSSSNFIPSTFETQSSNEYGRENRSILDNIRQRLDHLNVSARSTDSLIEGLLNIEQTENNLRRFRNYENLNYLTDSQE
ncbi:hypothetical protein ACKWTF_002700 [Chironomus riparius]